MEFITYYLNLNGYGWYVWPSYGICMAVWILIFIKSFHNRKAIEKKLAQLPER